MIRVRAGVFVGLVVLLASGGPATAAFVTFETGQARPLALSPNGSRLFAINTPDNRLEIFDIDAGTGALTPAGSVPVGLEPIAVAARNDAEVWVVNHLSDSVSVVDVASDPPRVVRTLLVGDEPRDVVFAGPGGNRAFITAAHRGQNTPIPFSDLLAEGIDRADVWVFDATNLGATLGGTPLARKTLFGDTPRALAVSPSGGTVYAAVFHSGNRTTTVPEGAVCNDPQNSPQNTVAASCNVQGVTMPGGLPNPDTNVNANPSLREKGPETGLIVKHNGTNWVDQLGRNWNNAVRFSLPDRDVFAIDANNLAAAPTPFTGVGTVIFNMAVNPVSGTLYVSNTDARNEVRFEGPGGGGTTVQGHLAETRITVIAGSTVTPRHLNGHIDYSIRPAPAGVKDLSLATPLGMAVSGDGATLYLAAFGSNKVGVYSTATVETTVEPSALSHITVPGGGPSGLVLREDPLGDRLYVLARFDNAISVIDPATGNELDHLPLHNPEPPSVVDGRPFLYDAFFTSSNGEAACASCHIFADFDSLAWDLGNPDDLIQRPNPNPIRVADPLGMSFNGFHPLKGPMTTQSLRGMAKHGPMHWRGDRTGGTDGGDPLDEDLAFKEFNVAFAGLLGRTGPLTDPEMQAFTDFILEVTYPPNPIRNLDNSLTPDQDDGRDFFLNSNPSDVFQTCNGCHRLDPAAGLFGSDGFSSFEFETQIVKIPHLRNMYQKVGMFGMVGVPFVNPGNNGNQGEQVRGFGFLHDGSIDTMFRFHNATVFNQDNPAGFPVPNDGGFPNGAPGDPLRRQVEAFMLVFDSNLAPIVGQQITLTSTNAGTVGQRINLLLARAAQGECDVVVKGNLLSEQRGWHRLANGQFQSDRAELLTDAELRGHATTAGQERTYTCVPPGSGQRIGVDRDEDGCFDGSDADPSDPTVGCPGGTTTTVSTTSTTSTTLPGGGAVLIGTKSLSLRDDAINVRKRKITFKASTKNDPPQNRIVLPARGSGNDPTFAGATLTVYNSAGLTNDVVTHVLDSSFWSYFGGNGYRFKGFDPNGPIAKITLKPDSLNVKGGKANWDYVLDDPAQGRVAVTLTMGTVGWCADAPAKARGNPPSSAKYDQPGRFVGEPKSPPPAVCPATP
jgi:YVTN family beta-propeller protein